MPINTRKHGTVTFEDSTGTPIVCTLGPGQGDFTIDGIEEAGWIAEPVFDRGAIYEWVYTQQAEISGQITIYHDGDLTDATDKKALDAVTKAGAFASGVSADTNGEAWTGLMKGTWTAHGVTNTLSKANCRFKASYSEGEQGNTIVISYRGYGTVTKTSA